MRYFSQTMKQAIFFLQVAAMLALAPVVANAEVGGTGTDAAPKPPAGSPPAPQGWSAPDDWLVYAVSIAVLVIAFFAIAGIRRALANTKWSLADALSEEVQVTGWDTSVTPNKPLLDASGNPLLVTEMCASSSRVIALMGMLVILLMFLGFGVFSLFSFGKTGTLPDSMSNVVDFLLSGLTLFAPYLVNKFSGLFGGLSSRQ